MCRAASVKKCKKESNQTYKKKREKLKFISNISTFNEMSLCVNIQSCSCRKEKQDLTLECEWAPYII